MIDDELIRKMDVLEWLIKYHKASFELKGRYAANQVIAWVVSDIANNLLFAEEAEDESD